MAVAKSVEIIASSSDSIEGAVRAGLSKAGETIDGIEEAWVKGTKAIVRDNQVVEWRVTLKVTFVVT